MSLQEAQEVVDTGEGREASVGCNVSVGSVGYGAASDPPEALKDNVNNVLLEEDAQEDDSTGPVDTQQQLRGEKESEAKGGGVGEFFRKMVSDFKEIALGREAGRAAFEHGSEVPGAGASVLRNFDPKNPVGAGLAAEDIAAAAPSQEALENEAAVALRATQRYLRLELEGSLSELQCLEELNRCSMVKYDELNATATDLEAFQRELDSRVAELEPALVEIDELYRAVGELENAAEQLDAYSRRLEEKANLLISRS